MTRGGVRPAGRALIALLALLLGASPALAHDPIRPDPRLTPGAVLSTDRTAICRPGYARSVRHTSARLKREVYREYGLHRRAGHYEIDHLIALELGGTDTRRNLWPQSYKTRPWNAHVKDRLENRLHREVCAGDLSLRQAQRAIATDWIAAERRYPGKR